LINEDVGAALDGRRVAESVDEWLKGQNEPPQPHPLEAELAKIQKVLDALEERPPLWWADKLLWRGLRWCAIRSLETVHWTGDERQRSNDMIFDNCVSIQVRRRSRQASRQLLAPRRMG
jgi:hypothetical protein